MLQWLRTKSHIRRKAGEIYGAVVAAARQPLFFREYSVPDTPEGRFEMVALVLFVVLERVKTSEPDGEALTQAVIEAFVTDMDDCMREMGVGDLTVPKRVKRAAAAFYERAGYYRSGLAPVTHGADPAGSALETALARFVFAGQKAGNAGGVAVYARDAVRALALAGDADLDGPNMNSILLARDGT
jgi:cytochrome b pre-mRNA-processing protein 3